MWYAEIADLYDALVRFDEDIPFFVEECIKARGPVLELMAGTGRVSIPIAEAGVDLTCVEISEEMLKRLRAKLAGRRLLARTIQGDVRRLDLPGLFSVAIIPFNSFSELTSEADRLLALEGIHTALRADGRLICTLHNPIVRLQALKESGSRPSRFPHPSGDGEVVFRMSVEYDPKTQIVRGIEVFEVYSGHGGLLETREVRIRFCLPDADWFRTAACKRGFTVEELYGDYQRSSFAPETSPFMIWLLRKSATTKLNMSSGDPAM
jgi:SAM-dependent methyltransferase